MCWTATLIFGLMALSGVLAYRVSPGSRWSSGPLDPSNIKRHNYVFSEFCPMYPRNMSFGDEIIVSSQRHWQDSYKTGVNCTMFINIDSPDLGLIVSLLTEETPDCQDYLELSPSQSDKLKYCGLKTNETGNTYNYMNESMVLNWYVPKRGENERHKGFSIMFTAFQYDCKTGQTCFPCENGLIIDQVHMCNGYNNCGDNTDEWDCPSNNPPRPPHPTPEPGPTPEPSPRTDTGSSTGMIIVSVLLFGALIAVAGLAYLSSKFLRERNLMRQVPGGERTDLFREPSQS